MTDPRPRFRRIRRLYIKNGVITCDCNYFVRVLITCRHCWAIKNGKAVLEDSHFRWFCKVASSHIVIPRTHNDGTGPTDLGVVYTEPCPSWAGLPGKFGQYSKLLIPDDIEGQDNYDQDLDHYDPADFTSAPFPIDAPLFDHQHEHDKNLTYRTLLAAWVKTGENVIAQVCQRKATALQFDQNRRTFELANFDPEFVPVQGVSDARFKRGYEHQQGCKTSGKKRPRSATATQSEPAAPEPYIQSPFHWGPKVPGAELQLQTNANATSVYNGNDITNFLSKQLLTAFYPDVSIKLAQENKGNCF